MTGATPTAVFLGPSLALAEARVILPDAQFFAPAQAGDVYRAYAFAGARTIVLIDGVFGPVPSVWHKEILGALEAGCAVVGASSMGALRAAECRTFGMTGHGWVFEQYARGMLDGDDEVALLHLGEEDEYLPITVPMVRLRHAVGEAIARRELSPRDGSELLVQARRIYYAERTWERLLAAMPEAGADVRDLLRRLRSSGADIKADDARSVLRMVARADLRAPANPIAVEDTAFWQRLREEAGAPTADGTAGRPSAPASAGADLIESTLLAPAHPGVGLEARVSAHLVVTMAEQLGIAPGAAEVSVHSDALRRRLGLTSRAAMTEWMQAHAITARAWTAAVRHDLLVDRLEDEFAGELRQYIPLVHARACVPPPAAPSDVLADRASSLHDLLRPVAEESGIPAVATYDELARRLGFSSVSDLVEAAQRADPRSAAS